ncbi:hypothetical protein [Sphingobacterium deserti]|uniref:Putative hemolysin n=1 Tax=Sphingobacterium deserti TaxID=1229276 RepID=A0A0B8T5T6_9SPHI|nr:hypothetical protein [Sphingobacterium deserti]KGE13114.1 putative hemolysin [Sphingobacterium deserti]
MKLINICKEVNYLTIILFLYVLGGHNAAAAQERSTNLFTKAPKDVYLGAIMTIQSINKPVHEFVAAEPMTMRVSTSSNTWENLSFELNSSRKDLQKKMEERYKPTSQNLSFSYAIEEITDYNRLSLYFGQLVDVKKWFKIPAGESETNKVMIHLEQILFTLDLDMMDPQKQVDAVKNKELNVDSLIIINSLLFGKKAVVLVESNQPTTVIRSILQSEIQGRELTPQQKSIMSTFTFRVAVFGTKKEIAFDNDKPLSNVLNFFNTSTDFLPDPLSFSAVYIKDNSVFENEYAIK